jgi:hypothetical protein
MNFCEYMNWDSNRLQDVRRVCVFHKMWSAPWLTDGTPVHQKWHLNA